MFLKVVWVSILSAVLKFEIEFCSSEYPILEASSSPLACGSCFLYCLSLEGGLQLVFAVSNMNSLHAGHCNEEVFGSRLCSGGQSNLLQT